MKEGDFVKLEYTGRIADSGEIFDLTDEELAKRNKIHNPKYKYGPVLVIIGAGMIVPGVEKQLKKMKTGEEKEFGIKPEDGFGKRDVKRIKIVSMANFIKQKVAPNPGAFVEINGRRAKIQSVSGGRVRLDFNHPLAGKNLKYRVKIVESIQKPLEKAKAITDYYGLPCELKLDEESLYIKTEEDVQEPVRKFLTDVITNWVKEIKKVGFSQTGKKTEEAREDKGKTEEKTKS